MLINLEDPHKLSFSDPKTRKKKMLLQQDNRQVRAALFISQAFAPSQQTPFSRYIFMQCSSSSLPCHSLPFPGHQPYMPSSQDSGATGTAVPFRFVADFARDGQLRGRERILLLSDRLHFLAVFLLPPGVAASEERAVSGTYEASTFDSFAETLDFFLGVLQFCWLPSGDLLLRHFLKPVYTVMPSSLR